MIKVTAKHVLLTLALLTTATSVIAHHNASQPTQAQQHNQSNCIETLASEPSCQSANQHLPVQQEQPSQQHNQNNPTEPPHFMTFLMWFTGAIITIFTALVAGFGIFTAVFTLRHKQEADDLLVKIKEHERKARKITKRMEANAEDADKDPDRINQVIRESKQQQLSDIDKARIDALELQKDKKFEEALAKWLAIAEFTNDREAASEAYFSAAYLMKKHKEKDESTVNKVLDLYSKSIKLYPTPPAYNNRGNAKNDLGKYAEAIADYSEAIKLKPDDPDAYYNRGSAKGALDKFEEAIADFSKAIELNSDAPDASAFYNRGNAKSKMGKHKGAIEDYTKAIKLKPDHPAAYSNRGLAKSKMGKHKGAIADFNEAIRLKPDFAGAYNNRGNCYRKMGKYDDAMRDANKSIELKETAHAYHTRAEIYRDQEKLDSAITNFSKAIELDNKLMVAYLDRGKTYQTAGKNEEALADFKKVLELEPRNEKDKKAIAAAKQAIAKIEARGKND